MAEQLSSSLYGRNYSAYESVDLEGLDHAQIGITEYVDTIKRLDGLDFSAKGLVLYLWGDPGTGKTHAALAGITHLTRDRSGESEAKDIGPPRVAYVGNNASYRLPDIGKKSRVKGSSDFGRDDVDVTGTTIFPEQYLDMERTTNIAMLDDYIPSDDPTRDPLTILVGEVYDKGGLLVVTSNTSDPSKELMPTPPNKPPDQTGEEELDSREITVRSMSYLMNEERYRKDQLRYKIELSRAQKLGQMIKAIHISGKNWRDGRNNWDLLGIK